jgi:hypothetical protein
MFLMMGRHWAALSILILADVAPTSSCGSDPVRPGPPVVLEIRASDCGCAPGVIEVLVDGRVVGELTCGEAGALVVNASEGSRVVSARSGELSWSPQTHFVRGGTTVVELGCPDA